MICFLCIQNFFQGPNVICPDESLIVMGGICCKPGQVNSDRNCEDKCPFGQVTNDDQVCEECPSEQVSNAAGDKCIFDCVSEGQILNSEGNACFENCQDEGEISNSVGSACLKNCSSGGETPDYDGDNRCDAN